MSPGDVVPGDVGLGDVVLAVNPGSSSLKAAVRDPEPRWRLSQDGVHGADGLDRALRRVRAELREAQVDPDVVVHRVVHGGPRHLVTTAVDAALLDDLRQAIPLAPLHLPSDIASIEASRRLWPRATHVACFDTAFHADLPETSRRLPVARSLAAQGVRRYGFHGLSIQSVLRAEPDLDEAVVAHLGSGCSVTAVAGGRSRHTTMSLTPTGGMMSVTRCGDIDPEVVLYLIEEGGHDVRGLRALLDRRSGLLGIAPEGTDVPALLSGRLASGEARLALEQFTRATAGAILDCALALSEFHTLVFTGGIGEHSPHLRERVVAALGRVGARGLDVRVVAADEQAVLDAEARELLGLTPATAPPR